MTDGNADTIKKDGPNDDRRAAILTLLRTRDDHLPTPSRRPDSASGFVHGERVRSCPDCLANHRVLKTCETCHGFGTVTGRRLVTLAAPDRLEGDDSRRDPYANDVVLPYGFDMSHRERERERDRQIQALDEQLRPASEIDELADANRRGYAWEEARKSMYRRFDYAALDRAVDELRATDEAALHAVRLVHVAGVIDVSAIVHAAAERGLVFLDGRLPDPIRAPGQEQKHPALRRRDGKTRSAA